jgi:molybdopterin molybdotransferase
VTTYRTVAEQLQAVLGVVEALEPFSIGLMESRGCVLAEDVTAPWPLPAFDTAAVDGYAVHALQTSVATADEPVVLRVIDSVRSGESSSRSLIPGTAIRVSAGSALPEETEAVIPVEHTNGGDEDVAVFRAAKYGQFVRRQGEDVQAGDVVASRGTAIDARLLGLLAAVGRSQVEARPRPRVVVVSIGSELLEVGAPIEPGKVPDTNGIMLAAAIAEVGGVAYRVGPISDDPDVIQKVLAEQLVRADLVITTGGTSAISYDNLRQVFAKMGNVDYQRVAMYPGGAQGYGTIGEEDVPVLALPSSPASAFVAFEVFVRPVLRRLFGLDPYGAGLQRATMLNGFASPPDKQHYVRGMCETDPLGRHVVTALEGQGSHLIASLARTECLIVVPAAVTDIAPGDPVEVLLLNDVSVW